MTAKRGWIVAGIAALLAMEACDSGDDSSGQSGPKTFAQSECASCESAACASQRSACDTEPECAAYLVCLDACELGADGDADPVCEAACTRPAAGTAAETAFIGFDACRASARGGTCPACGASTCGSHPVIDQCCSESQAADACDKCVQESCCVTREKYRADAEANALFQCIADCEAAGGSTCFATCSQSHPDGVANFAPQFVCFTQRCHEPCYGDNGTPCIQCVFSKCATEFANLQGTTTGFLYFNCVEGCLDPSNPDKTCLDNCESQVPGGKVLFDQYATCESNQCLDVCQ